MAGGVEGEAKSILLRIDFCKCLKTFGHDCSYRNDVALLSQFQTTPDVMTR